MRKLITARARKDKRTACMLANARKDHLIPLQSCRDASFDTLITREKGASASAPAIFRYISKLYRSLNKRRMPPPQTIRAE